MALTQEWIDLAFNYDITLAEPEDTTKMSESGHIGRAAIDGVLVVYDSEDKPFWLRRILSARDESGNVERKKEEANSTS